MGKYIIRQTDTGYKFDLMAANGEVIAASEVYNTEAACRKGIQSVIACAPIAKVADLTQDEKCPANPRFEMFRDKTGQFRFRLRARNGQVIAVSEGYATRAGCEKGIQSVQKNAAEEG